MGFQLRGRTKGKNAWFNWSASNGNGLRGSVSAKVSKNVTLNASSRGTRVTINLGNGLKWVSSSKKPRAAKTDRVAISPRQIKPRVSYKSADIYIDPNYIPIPPRPDEPFVFSEWIRSMDVISILSSLMIPVFLYIFISLSGAILYSILAAFILHWCTVGISYFRSNGYNRQADDLPIQLFAYPFILPGVLFFTPLGWSIILCTFLIFIFI